MSHPSYPAFSTLTQIHCPSIITALHRAWWSLFWHRLNINATPKKGPVIMTPPRLPPRFLCRALHDSTYPVIRGIGRATKSRFFIYHKKDIASLISPPYWRIVVISLAIAEPLNQGELLLLMVIVYPRRCWPPLDDHHSIPGIMRSPPPFNAMEAIMGRLEHYIEGRNHNETIKKFYIQYRNRHMQDNN